MAPVLEPPNSICHRSCLEQGRDSGIWEVEASGFPVRGRYWSGWGMVRGVAQPQSHTTQSIPNPAQISAG